MPCYPGTRLENAFAGVNRRHPGRVASGGVNNGELYPAGTWRFLTLKYSHAVTDYFSMPGTRGSGYVDLSAAHDLGNGYVGSDAQGRCANGEFYCFSSSLRSDGSGSGSRSRDAGRAVIVLSISRSF